MISENRRKYLVEQIEGFTLEGFPCMVAGWKHPYFAGVSSSFQGTYLATWEIVEEVFANDKNFTAKDISLSSWSWLGVGEKLPEPIAKKFLDTYDYETLYPTVTPITLAHPATRHEIDLAKLEKWNKASTKNPKLAND